MRVTRDLYCTWAATRCNVFVIKQVSSTRSSGYRRGLYDGRSFYLCSSFLLIFTMLHESHVTRAYPKDSGLAAWSENWKWYSSLPLSAVVSLLCELV
jgi:hypothetical protein